MNIEFLNSKIKERFKTQALFAKKLGVDPSTLSRWCKKQSKISLKDYEKIVSLLKLDKEEVDYLNGLTPSYYSLRTNNEHDLQLSEIHSKEVAYKIESIGDNILTNPPFAAKDEFVSHVNKISKIPLLEKEKVIKAIRSAIGIDEKTPLGFDQIRSLFELSRFTLAKAPFRLIGISEDQGTKIRGIGVEKGRSYLIVHDLERPSHSSIFTIVHELIHMFTKTVGKKDNQTEEIINYIAAELIYPQEYLREKMPRLFNREKGKNATLSLLDLDKVCNMFAAQPHYSSKAVARALVDNGVIKKNGRVYNFFCKDESESFQQRKDLGVYNFDHYDFDQVLDFYKNYVISNPTKYIFYFLPLRSLHRGKISFESFGAVFNFDSEDSRDFYQEVKPLLENNHFFIDEF